MHVTPMPQKIVKNSRCGPGKRNILALGLTVLLYVHVEYFVERQSSSPSIKAGLIADVKNVVERTQIPIFLSSKSVTHSNEYLY